MPIEDTRDGARDRKLARKASDAWVDPESLATTLVLLYVDGFGTEGLAWDAATIRSEVEETYAIKLPEANYARLMAAINILTSNQFFVNRYDFIELCNVLDGDTLSPGEFSPADADAVAWGITEALLLSPPEEGEDEPFSDDVRWYVGAVCDDEGIFRPRDVLRVGLKGALPRGPGTAARGADAAESAKNDEIDEHVKNRLRMLVSQLESLDLSNGSTADLAARLRKHVPRAQ